MKGNQVSMAIEPTMDYLDYSEGKGKVEEWFDQ